MALNKKLKLYIQRNYNYISISCMDQNGNTILYNNIYNNIENNISELIKDIDFVSKYLIINSIDAYIIGEEMPEEFNEFCYYLNQLDLNINYIVKEIKNKTKVKNK